MAIKQGDLYWLQATRPDGADTGQPHPYVVIQDDVINQSRVPTIVVCALTTNLRRMAEPGNVLLEAGEANLPKASVVVVSQIEAVAKTAFDSYIGTLAPARVAQIFAGMRFQQAAFFARG